MDFPRLPSRRARLTSLAAIALLLATPATADPLKEIGGGFDEAGRALNRQVGEWFGTAKPPRASRRRALPATAPLPLPRPADKGVAESAASTPAEPTTDAPAAAPAHPSVEAAPAAPVPPPAPDAVRVAALPAPATPLRGEEKPTPQDRAQAATSTREAAVQEAAGQDDPHAEQDGPASRTAGSAPSAGAARSEPVPEPHSARRDEAAAPIPLPPARPAAPAEPRVAALPPPPAEPAPASSAAPAPPTICPELSVENLGEFTPVTVTATQAACAVDRGVSLTSVRMKDGRVVPLEPAAVLRCEMAASVAHWLRDEVDPATAALGSKLSGVMVAASQQCRPRNRVAGAKISEHGRGNAIDLRGLELEDGRRFVIGTPAAGASKEVAMPLAFRETLKAGACADFTTILGPGSDGYHEQHLHLDRAERRSGAVLCQWAVAGPPPKAPDAAPKKASRHPAAPTPPVRPADAPADTDHAPADTAPATSKAAP